MVAGFGLNNLQHFTDLLPYFLGTAVLGSASPLLVDHPSAVGLCSGTRGGWGLTHAQLLL